MFRGEREVHLSPTEFRLLRYFLEHPGRVFSREQLLDRVWGCDLEIELRTVAIARGRLAAIVESAEDAIIGRDLDGTITRSDTFLPFLIGSLWRTPTRWHRTPLLAAAVAMTTHGRSLALLPTVIAIGASVLLVRKRWTAAAAGSVAFTR